MADDFIPGKSICPLCSQPVKRKQPYIDTACFRLDPSQPLHTFCQSFLHKACFLQWPRRASFIETVNLAEGDSRLMPDGTIRKRPMPFHVWLECFCMMHIFWPVLLLIDLWVFLRCRPLPDEAADRIILQERIMIADGLLPPTLFPLKRKITEDDIHVLDIDPILLTPQRRDQWVLATLGDRQDYCMIHHISHDCIHIYKRKSGKVRQEVRAVQPLPRDFGAIYFPPKGYNIPGAETRPLPEP